MMATEGRFLSQTSASCLQDTRFTVSISSQYNWKFFLYCLINANNLQLPCFLGAEPSPALLVPSGTSAKRSSSLEQAPISDRPSDRLNTLNSVINSQTLNVHKRRPGKN